MSMKRYTDEFKIETVRQIVEYGRPVAEVAERLGVSIHSIYGWKRSKAKARLADACELSKSACFFRMAFIVYRKCLRTFTAAQQHLRRFPRVSAGIAQNSLR